MTAAGADGLRDGPDPLEMVVTSTATSAPTRRATTEMRIAERR